LSHTHEPVTTGQVAPHAHHDGPGHGHAHRPVSRRRLLLSMALTGAMMVVELVGGILSGSLALVSDAGHMFTHFFALGVSYVAIRIAMLPVEPERSYGWFRAEIIAALVNGIFLAGATVFIGYESIVRLMHPTPIEGGEMLAIATLGLAVNLVSMALLWGVSHGDLNVRSAFFHMMGDALSSVAVVAGAAAIMVTGVLVIDPILSLLITVVIGIWSYRLLAQSVRILMESTPHGLDLADLERSLAAADPRVRRVHDLHVWEITSGMRAMTAIVDVDPAVPVGETTDLLEHLRAVAGERFAIGHAIIQVESAALADRSHRHGPDELRAAR
jgi:cobalt-zinc-cadmium efflux system protein